MNPSWGWSGLVSVGLYVVEVGQLPSPRQRLRYVIQATQPKAGSVEMGALMEQAYWMGPLFQELYMTGLSDIIWQWISGINEHIRRKKARRGTTFDCIYGESQRKHGMRKSWGC